MDVRIRPHNRRLLLPNAPHRRTDLPPLPDRHGRPRRVPRHVGDIQPPVRRLPPRLRHHQRQLAGPAGLLQRPHRHGERDAPGGVAGRARPALREARQDRRGKQVRFAGAARGAGAGRPRVGAQARLRLHGDERAQHGEYRGDVRADRAAGS